MKINSVEDIRREFSLLYQEGNFVQDKTGVKCVEIINSSFVADEESIFGTPNLEYI